MSGSTAAIAASVVEKTHRPGLFFINNTLGHEQTSYTKQLLLVLYNTCRHILDTSPSEWHLSETQFCPQKTNNRTLYLRDAFSGNGNVAIFITYKNGATVMSL